MIWINAEEEEDIICVATSHNEVLPTSEKFDMELKVQNIAKMYQVLFKNERFFLAKCSDLPLIPI